MTLIHVFLVSFPGQGHINPLLRLGKRLASTGLLVTFSGPESSFQGMMKSDSLTDEPVPVGDGFIRFEFFPDEWAEDEPRPQDLDLYLPQLELVGRRVVPHMLRRYAEQGRPVSCLINNPFIPWVSDVADELGLPSAMLWVQSCACFAAYYHYSRATVNFPSEADPEADTRLPCMPALRHDEVPSFLHPTTPYHFLRRAILGQFKNLDKPFCVLIDTFQELEREVVDYMSSIFPVRTVGPLFKNKTLETLDSVTDNFLEPDACMEWLDSKTASSVVYISFGSVVHLEQDQVNEIAGGIVNAGVSFLWVMKPPHQDTKSTPDAKSKPHVLPEGFMDKVGERGKVVKWSPQEKVLAHPAVACFVTHCGWNSTMEAMASGVPVVALPQFGDQVTNAKYLVDVWKMGIRMGRGEADGRVVSRYDVAKCLLDATVGSKAAELKENAVKWKEAAEAALVGSSDKNMRGFVAELRRKCSSG